MSLALITEFIAAVNTTFLNGKKADELNALWQTISSVPKCPGIVKSGARQGEVCGKSCIKGKEFCLCHMPREVLVHDECSFILTSGKREGQMCGKSCPVGTFCTAHRRVIVPCTFIMKSGDRQGQACGVTCSSGTICKKHIKMNEAAVAEAAVAEVAVAEVAVAEVAVAEVAVAEAAVAEVAVAEVTPMEVSEVAVSVAVALGVEVDAVAAVQVAPVAEVSMTTEIIQEAMEIVHAATCGAILKSGSNKGKVCGKNCVSGTMACSTHRVVSRSDE